MGAAWCCSEWAVVSLGGAHWVAPFVGGLAQPMAPRMNTEKSWLEKHAPFWIALILTWFVAAYVTRQSNEDVAATRKGRFTVAPVGDGVATVDTVTGEVAYYHPHSGSLLRVTSQDFDLDKIRAGMKP